MVPDNSQELRKSFLLTLLSDAEIVWEKQRAAKLKAIQQAEYMTEPSMGDTMVLELTWDQVEKWILAMFS